MSRLLGKPLRVESPIGGPTAKVPTADFPNQIPSMFAVMHGNRPFARVMREPTQLGPSVQGLNGISRKRTKTHRRNIEYGGIVGLRSIAADPDSEVGRFRHFGGCNRMIDPLKSHGIGIKVGPERTLVEYIF